MMKVYEIAPKYCRVTDGLVGSTRRLLAEVETRAQAREVRVRWFLDMGDYDADLGLTLEGPRGECLTFDDPTPPAPQGPVTDDDIPF